MYVELFIIIVCSGGHLILMLRTLIAQLNMDVVCIALGGLGSSFDQLAMNRELLVRHNVRLRGVILNKVNPDKMDMIQVCFSSCTQLTGMLRTT